MTTQTDLTLDDFCNVANALYAEPTEQRFYDVVNLARDLLAQVSRRWDDGYQFGRAESDALKAANTKLVGAIDMIREALNGGDVQDLHQIINTALSDYKSVQKPSDSEAFGRDLWAGIV